MNQLVRADDNVSHKTYVYTYDVGGNRTATKIYDFTLETLEGEPTVITQTYGFDLDSNVMRWNDRLKTYNGRQIIYDLEGNPVSYGGKTLNWYGKQLKQMTAADGSYTQYDYDANGLRTQKRHYKSDGTTDYTVDYVWSDGKIAVQSLTYPLTMTIQGNTVTRDIKIDSKFIYCDDDATPSAIILENDEYLLVRNLQGDVVAVVSASNGETVVEFSYDPWGNVTRKYSETYTNGATEEELKFLDLVMSVLCPVTYRGYNYDFTTGLYYLQSRYYNPEWGRFLNTDDTSIMLTKTDDAFSANMYLYCNNNPVNKVDYSGRLSYSVEEVIGYVIDAVVAIQIALIDNGVVPSYYVNGFPGIPGREDIPEQKSENLIQISALLFRITRNTDGSEEIFIWMICNDNLGRSPLVATVKYKTRSQWLEYSKPSIFVNIVKDYNEFFDDANEMLEALDPLLYGITEVAPPIISFPLSVVQFGYDAAGRLIPDNYTKKQNAFIRIELKRQKTFYPELNGAYILMEYAYNTQFKNAVKHEGWECRAESVKDYINARGEYENEKKN